MKSASPLQELASFSLDLDHLPWHLRIQTRVLNRQQDSNSYIIILGIYMQKSASRSLRWQVKLIESSSNAQYVLFLHGMEDEHFDRTTLRSCLDISESLLTLEYYGYC